MIVLAKTDISWDLSEIFPSTKDPSVQKAIDDLGRMAEHFAKKYQGKIAGLSVEQLAECIRGFEAFQAKLDDVITFSDLSFAANMTLPETQSLHDKTMKLGADL